MALKDLSNNFNNTSYKHVYFKTCKKYLHLLFANNESVYLNSNFRLSQLVINAFRKLKEYQLLLKGLQISITFLRRSVSSKDTFMVLRIREVEFLFTSSFYITNFHYSQFYYSQLGSCKAVYACMVRSCDICNIIHTCSQLSSFYA